MSVKIINVLKDDSFNDILELFRQASATEVILVLPRVGKLFRNEDHFAAFASEAQQAGKTVSVLTANPQTAKLARKFGFGVMTSGSAKASRPKAAAAATLATAPMVADFSIPSDDDTADQGDVPLTSDEVTAKVPEEGSEDDPMSGMHIEDAEGNVVDEDGDGNADEPDEEELATGESADFVAAPVARPVATLAAMPKRAPSRPPQPNDVDGVRPGVPARSVAPMARSESAEPVAVTRAPALPDDTPAEDLDYIDAVWRKKNGDATPEAIVPPTPSLFGKALSGTARMASGSSMPKKTALAILGSAVIVLAAVIWFITGSARVALTPVSKPIDVQITVQASDTFTSVDEAFAKIPGQLIEVSKRAEKTVTASGTRDVASKARGKITVYNEYSSTPQTLVATTRFQSESGKVYRTLQTITVPGSTVSAGQTVPGKITVDVIADLPGSDYNIPAGRFVIMAFREKGETDKVEKFYGKSEAPMSGGASGPSAVVTKDDYDKARQAAEADVRAQVTAALEAQGAGLVVLDADKPVISELKATANPDDAAESITVTATATLRTVAFRKADLEQLLVKTIMRKERLTVLPDRLELTYRDLVFKQDLGTLVFTVAVKGTGYMPVDVQAIKRDIAGKNAQAIRDYFSNREGITSATVALSPFWVRKVPTKTERITVDLVYGPATE